MEEFEEYTLASAARYLVEGQEFYEASILLLCTSLNITTGSFYYRDGESVTEVNVVLSGNRGVYEIVNDENNKSTIAINRAIQAALGQRFDLTSLSCRAFIDELEPNWRIKLLDVIEGKIPLNQGIPIQDKPRFSWENLFFRSPVEISIAKSLDKTGVLFLPNCMARLGLSSSRENREADFLICYEGKWGILEINGETFHTSAAKDHDRSRLFKLHSIRVFEPYDAKRCINEPNKVVKEFLEILKKNG